MKKGYLHSYIILFVIISAIIGFITFGIVIYNINRELRERHIDTSERVARNVEDKMTAVEMLISQISQTGWVKKIMYMQGNMIDYDRISFHNLLEYEGELMNYTVSNGFIDDIAIVFYNKDLALSTFGRHNVKDFKDYVFKIGNEGFWGNLNFNYSKPEYTLFCEVEFFGFKKRGLLYYANLPINTVKTVETTALLFTDISKLEALFKNNYNFEEKYILTDSENKVVLTDVEHLSYGSVFNTKLKSYKTFVHKSEMTGWNYYTMVPKSKIYQQFAWSVLATFLIFVIVIFLGVVIILKFFGKRYKILDEFIVNIKTNLKLSDEMVVDEFYQINAALASVFQRQRELEIEIERQKPIIKNKYLSLILTNDKKVDEFGSLNISLDISFPYSKFICMSTKHDIIALPVPEDIKEYEIDLIATKAILLNYDSLSDKYFDEMIRLNDNLSIGVGEEMTSIDEISESYEQSIKAYSYCDILKQRVVFYHDIESKGDYYFPEDAREKLCNCIKISKEYEVAVLINHLAEENEKNSSSEALLTFYIDIQLIAIRLLNEIRKGHDLDLAPSIKYANKKDATTFCINVCRIFKDYIEKSKDAGADELLNYIDNHFTDNDISLYSVGKRFGFSQSYISKAFKEKYNTNFLDYINKKRIKLCCKMLLESNLDILAIAQKAGYDNDVTFRRLFKKYMGITPSEYRKGNL